MSAGDDRVVNDLTVNDLTVSDLIVVGAGPAGRALAYRAALSGLDTTIIDPDPQRRWRATYGAWTDELPEWLPHDCVAARAEHAVVYTPQRRVPGRGYAILDNDALQRLFAGADIHTVTGRAVEVTSTTVTLATGSVYRAATVIDARGNVRAEADAPRQRAWGVRSAVSDDLHGGDMHGDDVPGDDMVVMDWRAPAGCSPGTFLYRVPLNVDAALYEETCLAGAPATSLPDLARRLAARVPGVVPDARVPDHTDDVEIVDFALLPADPRPWRRTADAPSRFGAGGGLMNPATGYSVAAALTACDDLVSALLAGRDPAAALWPRSARWAYRLRVIGLRALLGFDPVDLVAFFDAFFGLPIARQRDYTSGRSDLAGVLKSMLAVYFSLDRPMRRSLISSLIRGGA